MTSPAATDSAELSGNAAPPAGRRVPPRPVIVLAALAGGLAAAALVRNFGEPFVTPPYPGMSPPPGWNELARSNRYLNSAVSGALLGLSLGIWVGIVAGLSRRSAAAVVWGGAGGLVAGAGFGAAGGWVGMASYLRLTAAEGDRTTAAIAVHVAMFFFVGVGVAAGAVASGWPRRALAAGALGGVLAGLIYPVCVVVCFPPTTPDYPLPERLGPALLWAVLPGLCAGAALCVVRHETEVERRPDALAP